MTFRGLVAFDNISNRIGYSATIQVFDNAPLFVCVSFTITPSHQNLVVQIYTKKCLIMLITSE